MNIVHYEQTGILQRRERKETDGH